MRFSMRSVFLCAIIAAGCGGGQKKPEPKPQPKPKPKPVVQKPETEEDRVAKRLAAAHEIVPEGTNCLPPALKPGGEMPPELELGVVDGSPMMCAFDTDASRLLGPVACWKVNLEDGALTWVDGTALPGRGYAVRLDDRCARGYCLPEDVALPTPPIVHLAWSHKGDKIAVAIPGSEPEIHLFGAQDKAHAGVIKPKDPANAEKALPTDLAGVVFVGDVIAAVGTAGDTGAPVFLWKTDGTAVGPVERLGGKLKGAVSVANGSTSVFGDGQIALNEDALATLTTIEVATGKRAKLVRKPPKTSCKQKDIDALLAGAGDKVKDKCKADFAKSYAPFVGALMVQGRKNHLALLRGDRYGELAILDAKTLEERRHFPAAWCEAASAEPAGETPADAGDPAPSDDAGSDE
jgi:hypothetical protein